MKSYNILIAFANENVSCTAARMLMSGGIKPSRICSSSSELKKLFYYYQNGIVISGYKLKDYSIVQFIDDIPDKFSIILVGNKAQMELCQSDRFFKLAVPLQKEDLIYSVSMLLSMQSAAPKASLLRTEEENRIIRVAKESLIDRYTISEEQAYRYMQKKSMNTGLSLVEIAKIILN